MKTARFVSALPAKIKLVTSWLPTFALCLSALAQGSAFTYGI